MGQLRFILGAVFLLIGSFDVQAQRINSVKCNIDFNKCLGMIRSVCGANYKVHTRGSHMGGLLADILPGPVVWFTATYSCVEISRAPPAPQKKQAPAATKRPFRFVARDEALSFIVNILNRAGITGYEILPTKKPGDPAVYVRYKDGSLGSFLAAMGNTATADDYASYVAGLYTKGCRGDARIGKENVPTTDGTVKRSLRMACRSEGTNTLHNQQADILRFPDGLLIAWYTSRLDRLNEPDETVKQKARTPKGLDL